MKSRSSIGYAASATLLALAMTMSASLIVSFATTTSQDGKKEKTVEEEYKNIQTLKGMPAKELMGAMQFFAKSLGVDCTHCHVLNEFEKDDKPAKLNARKMFELMRFINRRPETRHVTCYTCHRGNAQPERIPASFMPTEEERKKIDEDKRPAEQVYKNIQVFKGAPAGRILMVMNMFARTLGVDCSHCHVGNEFERDDRAAKQTARKMLGLVGSISQEIYKGSTPVSCYTCHKGQPMPALLPPAKGGGDRKSGGMATQ